MGDQVTNEVLRMIAEQQRNLHAQNQEAISEILAAVREIQNAVHTIRIDVAVLTRDVAELKVWRQTVDTFITATRDNVSEARGGLKGLRLAVSLGASGTVGAFLAKLLPGLLAGLK